MTPPLYADDPDITITYPITDATGTNLTFTPLTVKATHTDATVVTITTATWQGAAAPTRDLTIPLTGLKPGLWALRLVITSSDDLFLGNVHLE